MAVAIFSSAWRALSFAKFKTLVFGIGVSTIMLDFDITKSTDNTKVIECK